MSKNDYIDSMNKLARKKQIKESKAMMQAILKTYEKSMHMYMRQWVEACKKHGPNHTVSTKYKYALMFALHSKILKIQEDYGIKASNIYNDLAKTLFGDKDEFEESKKYAELLKRVDNINDVGNQKYLEMIYSGGLYKDGKGLSTRLWDAVSISGNKIQEEIMACISQGMASNRMYKHLKDFVKSGKASYNATRLARTTYCHMSQQASIDASKKNPYVGGIKWHSVHATGRTCDICKERDGKIYKPKDLPFDHPNGMCYMEEVLMINGKEASLQDITNDLKKWINGEPNSGIMDKWYKQSNKLLQASKKSAHKVTDTIKKPKPSVKEFINMSRQDAKKWSNEWLKNGKYAKLSKNELDDINNYTSSSYLAMNDWLRYEYYQNSFEYANKDALLEGIQNVIKGLDKLKADRDVIVHRGAPIKILQQALNDAKLFDDLYEKVLMDEISNKELTNILAGIKLSDKGFMSTSVNSTSAFSGELQYHIKVPKGSNAGGYINGISKYKDSEYEFLLKPGTEVVIKNATSKNGILHVHCALVEKNLK